MYILFSLDFLIELQLNFKALAGIHIMLLYAKNDLHFLKIKIIGFQIFLAKPQIELFCFWRTR